MAWRHRRGRPAPTSVVEHDMELRWLPGYENGRSAQIFAQPVNGLWQNLISWGKSIVKPVGEVICIRKFPNFSDDTLTNQMLVCNVDVYC